MKKLILILLLILTNALAIDPLAIFIPNDKELHMLGGFCYSAYTEKKHNDTWQTSLIKCLELAVIKEGIDCLFGDQPDIEDIAWTMAGWGAYQLVFKIEFDIAGLNL